MIAFYHFQISTLLKLNISYKDYGILFLETLRKFWSTTDVKLNVKFSSIHNLKSISYQALFHHFFQRYDFVTGIKT